ncbi:hypothetical protein [Planococcus shixiaomingii]|uniref:hypothetical protein n=1 Tax=Planococcus shixiaomingii TaxID=3058393 RepID=UPI0026277D81|nr:hypothetical protein [Planococcus sp. N022]WKA54629.1 hypothetical protein QWY21_18485 [Planococcus sp. N022]
MQKKRILVGMLTAVIIIVLLYTATYIPKKMITIEPAEVSKIEVFDGNSGTLINLTEKDQIKHIISNLNETTFKKKGLSIGYMGYNYRLTIYDADEEEYKELIINSSDTIRYNGFFYESENNSVDDGYIDELFSAEKEKAPN